MADPRLDDLRALRNMIDEAHDIVSTVALPQGRSQRCREILGIALRLADDLIATPQAPAVELGKRGGLKTAERGPDYFKNSSPHAANEWLLEEVGKSVGDALPAFRALQPLPNP